MVCLQASRGPEMNLLAQIHWVEAMICLALGVFCGMLLWRCKDKIRKEAQESRTRNLLEHAQREAENLVRETKLSAAEEAAAIRRQAEKLRDDRQRELASAEERLAQREELVNQQLQGFVERERNLLEHQRRVQQQQEALLAKSTETEALLNQRRRQLAEAARLSEADARAQLLKEVEQQTRKEATDLARRIVDEAQAGAEEKARRIISLAVQRYAGEHTFETTTATVALNGADIKGRIIGREGRNIRAFEAATGITVLIDDTPNAVVLSGFDPVRREVARQAMERLVQDGRIHPTRIEEVVAKVNQEIEETALHAGEAAVARLGLPPLPEDLVRLLGRLRFRHSFSQNILDHSVEVAQLAGLMAAELGEDIAAAKRTGLLHDIGKAVNHEAEGSHARVGAEIARRCGESENIVNGIASHHGEVEQQGVLGVLVSAADAISASRPGARSESMGTYLKRLEGLERIGASFAGVEKCYAVQAGRELRIIVKPDEVTDEDAYDLARGIARKIEDDLLYPGQIRVTVVRETRCVEFAK
jgi:ribonuclease Y